ncbi:MAG: DinB family protein [Dehalococcoidia bacterium]|nr:DinB family protein [Dehalococcoidia bacterium]
MTPLPEIRSLIQRARSNRMMLYQLLEQFPGDAWEKRGEDDAWTARQHLQHLATIDTVTQDLVDTPGTDDVLLGEATLVQRHTAMQALEGEPVDELTRQLDESRDAFLASLVALTEERLGRQVIIHRPGVWPPEQRMSLRAYLGAWAEHDAEHAAAIRQAATAQLSPTDMAAAARLTRRRRQ